MSKRAGGPMIGLSYNELRKMHPCEDALRRVAKLMGGAKKWGSVKIDAATARARGATFDDILWVAARLAPHNPDVKRRLLLWMADCTARVLAQYERQFPGDDRVRACIVAARAYARGEIAYATYAAYAARSAACGAAYVVHPVWGVTRSAAESAARSAARSVACAAYVAEADHTACFASWSVAVSAAYTARSAVRSAVYAAGGSCDAAWNAADAAYIAETDWQFARLIARLSGEEPDDWPLPRLI